MNLSHRAGSRFKTARLKDDNRYSVTAATSAVDMRPSSGPVRRAIVFLVAISISCFVLYRSSVTTTVATSGVVCNRYMDPIFTRQLMREMEILKIVHRDIKPANLLLNSKNEVKIADFRVSKILVRSLDSCTSYVGTCAYMSLERFDSEYAGGSSDVYAGGSSDVYAGGNSDVYAGDIWSFGLMMLELLVGHFPLLPPGQRPDWAMLTCVACFGEPPRAPESCSEEFRSFVDCCLRKDSSQRWMVSQLLGHPFLRKDL